MGCGGVAFLIDARAVFKAAVCCQCRLHTQERVGFAVFDIALARRNACGAMRGGNHQKDGLTEVVHLALGQERLVMG